MEKLSQILHQQAKKQGDPMIRRGRTQGNNSDDKFRAPTFFLTPLTKSLHKPTDTELHSSFEFVAYFRPYSEDFFSDLISQLKAPN